MDTLSHNTQGGAGVEADNKQEPRRHHDETRILVLYKNLVRYNNFTNACNLDETLHSFNEVTLTRKKVVSETWSVYKQLIPVFRPRKLSCMESVSEVATTRTLDIKTRMREMQQLEEDVRNFIADETAFQRLKRTYTFDVTTGRPSVQMERFVMLLKLMFCGLFCIGGYKGYIEGHQEFMQRSKFVMFASKGAAHKKRNNYVMKSILEHGIKFSLKGGILSCSIFGLYQCLEIYINRSTPWTLAVAFGVGGGLAKISLGPKGMFSNFVIASVLGQVADNGRKGEKRVLSPLQGLTISLEYQQAVAVLCGGFISWCGAKISGETQEELNYQAVKAKLLAKRQFQISETRPVTDYHEEVDEID